MTIKKYILLSISTLMLAGCTSEDINNTPADERLPLKLEATLSSGRPVTRAAGSTIESTDELMSYVRHIYATDISTETDYSKYASVQASPVKFTIVSAGTALYWDDFSNSEKEETDLRTSNHGLQSYYGYCYNGGTPSTALVETTGVLGWTIASDQSSAEALKNNDLLWSPSQKAVKYDHAKDNHGTLAVPFTHAMSKFTIVVVAGDGFKADDLDKATVTLNGMNSVGTFTAPTPTVTDAGTPISVSMFGNAKTIPDADKPYRTYEAMVVPATSLTKDKHLADINIAGNQYKVSISNAILTAWATGIENNASKSGVNYKLTVTLNKQVISTVATLANWNSLEADGNGEIVFETNVKDINFSNASGLKDDDSFALWLAEEGKDFASAAATIVTYKTDKFVNETPVYWANGSTKYNFRALAKTTKEHLIEAVSSTEVSQSTDLLWGTTAAHTGTESDGTTTHDYVESAAINPRTGAVPLVFKHAMSIVVVKLETTTDDASKVTLDEATVKIPNLLTGGSVNIATGAVTASGTAAEVPISGETIMVPQTIGDNCKLVVTLKDGTTYSLQINQLDSITAWASGNKYTYTITLQKEAVMFRALVEVWKENNGSGNATLDWD